MEASACIKNEVLRKHCYAADLKLEGLHTLFKHWSIWHKKKWNWIPFCCAIYIPLVHHTSWLLVIKTSPVPINLACIACGLALTTSCNKWLKKALCCMCLFWCPRYFNNTIRRTRLRIMQLYFCSRYISNVLSVTSSLPLHIIHQKEVSVLASSFWLSPFTESIVVWRAEIRPSGRAVGWPTYGTTVGGGTMMGRYADSKQCILQQIQNNVKPHRIPQLQNNSVRWAWKWKHSSMYETYMEEN